MPNLRVKTTMVHHDEEAGYPKEALLPRTTKDEAKGGPVSHQEGPLRLHPAFYVAYVHRRHINGCA